jgi:hypothetical protein
MPNWKRETSLCLDQASFENDKKKTQIKKNQNKLLLKFTHPILRAPDPHKQTLHSQSQRNHEQ